MRELFSVTFQRRGFTSHCVENGAEAVRAVEQQSPPFDAIVLDMQMPVLNGLGALTLIRQFPECRETPIVLLTAHGAQIRKAHALECGANWVALKPIVPDELITILCSLM